MDLVRSIRSTLMRRWADPARRDRRRIRAEQRRQRDGRPHTVLYFHQVDDPYSQLAVQALTRLLDRYDIQLIPKLVAAPTPIAIHDQALWDQWARRECAAIAPFYGLKFSTAATATPEQLDLARRVMLLDDTASTFATHGQQVSDALQQGDTTALESLYASLSLPDAAETARRLEENFKLRHRLGHYLGAMFHYEGEWYWGIDRLHYLEARLDALGTRRAQAPPGPCLMRRDESPAHIDSSRRLQLEFFPSLRSPYTHLTYARVEALCARYPVDLVVRPVLPMMMRGVKADRRKGIYILQDTQREADRLGIAFGNIWDPFGKPILRAYSLFPWARDQGRGLAYLSAYSQAVWAERVDAWSLTGLRHIVERAGLDWSQALKHLDNRDWEVEMEDNVQAMIAAGSWGVPTLRLPAQQGEAAFTVWGQDRLWLIEAELARRCQHTV